MHLLSYSGTVLLVFSLNLNPVGSQGVLVDKDPNTGIRIQLTTYLFCNRVQDLPVTVFIALHARACCFLVQITRFDVFNQEAYCQKSKIQ